MTNAVVVVDVVEVAIIVVVGVEELDESAVEGDVVESGESVDMEEAEEVDRPDALVVGAATTFHDSYELK